MGARFAEALAAGRCVVAADHYEVDRSEVAPVDGNDRSVAEESAVCFAVVAGVSDGYPASAGSGAADSAPDDCSAARMAAGCWMVRLERYSPDDCLVPVDSSAAGWAAADSVAVDLAVADWGEPDSAAVARVAAGCSAAQTKGDHCVPVAQRVESFPDDYFRPVDFPESVERQAAYFQRDACCPPDSRADSSAGCWADSKRELASLLSPEAPVSPEAMQARSRDAIVASAVVPQVGLDAVHKPAALPQMTAAVAER